MAGINLRDRITKWVQDAIGNACMGDEYGYDVIAQGGIGNVGGNGKVTLNYVIVLTHRHPLLKQPDGQPHQPIMGGFVIPANQVANEKMVTELTQGMMTALVAKFNQEREALRSGRRAGLVIPGDPGSTFQN